MLTSNRAVMPCIGWLRSSSSTVGLCRLVASCRCLEACGEQAGCDEPPVRTCWPGSDRLPRGVRVAAVLPAVPTSCSTLRAGPGSAPSRQAAHRTRTAALSAPRCCVAARRRCWRSTSPRPPTGRRAAGTTRVPAGGSHRVRPGLTGPWSPRGAARRSPGSCRRPCQTYSAHHQP
jgi:hypothetical protein